MDALQSEDSKGTPLGFGAPAYRCKIINKFEELFIKTSACFDA
jgi:hypothetical protein